MNDDKELFSKRCSFMAALNSKGVDAYTTPDAKKIYARSLLKLSDKFFWAPIATLLSIGFSNRNDVSFVLIQCTLTAALLAGGIYLRHCALVIYDGLPKKNKKKRPSLSASVEEPPKND